jgi:hypothetical protein
MKDEEKWEGDLCEKDGENELKYLGETNDN